MIKDFFRQLANLKFAIGLLLIIALISSIGSIIEQDKDILFYQKHYSNQIFGVGYWEIISMIGLNTIYKNWWFLSLLFLLSLSLIACTIFQQLPTLKFSKRFYFYKQANQFKKLPFKLRGYKIFSGNLEHNLIQNEYSIFRQRNTTYAYKGLISRIGPIFVHMSIICVLFGSTIDALQGFSSQEIVPKTELFHTQNIIKHGSFSFVPQKTFRINDFWSNYINSGHPRQFYSDISILSGDGIEIERKTISVNNPFLTDNLLLYQTDWGILGLRTEIMTNHHSNYVFQLPVSKIQNTSSQKIWISWIADKTETEKSSIIVIKDIRGQVNVYTRQGRFLTSANLNDRIFWTNLLDYKFIELISSAGLQIKSDPGIKLTYVGFSTLIGSSILSYISFSEFWLLSSTQSTIFVGGRSNRAKLKYNLEFTKFKQSLLE